MNKQEIMRLFEDLVGEAKAAVLATVDGGGKPHIRWMTPACLRNRPDTVFMVSASGFRKVDHAKNNAAVELMIQSHNLDRVLNLRGTITVVENPSLRTEVLECLGGRLHAFWNINNHPDELVVLEMIVDEATYYVPMKGTKESVSFA